MKKTAKERGPTAKKITMDQLQELLADPKTTQENLRPYFREAEGAEPFEALIEVNPQTVEMPAGAARPERSARLLNWANSWSRADRRRRFERRMADGYRGPVIVSEGDSWFQYPIVLDDPRRAARRLRHPQS